jgi:hypothetical protein
MSDRKIRNKPVALLRHYPVQAAIWRNDAEGRAFHSVSFSRCFKKDGAYKNAESFSGAQLLQLAHLAQQAYDLCRELDQDANEPLQDLSPEFPCENEEGA